MSFHLPRRHRRRLLLPPGLVALAGLLLLGCLALRPWQERLTRHSVLQLTLPTLQARHNVLAGVFEPEKLPEFHEWYDSYLDGSQSGDARRAAGITGQAAAMQTRPDRDQRLRVQLGPQATFAEMVFLLNTMGRFNIKKYAFDIRKEAVTFYAFTVLPLAHHRHAIMPAAAGFSYQPPVRPYPSSYDRSASYRSRLRLWQNALWTFEHGQ